MLGGSGQKGVEVGGSRVRFTDVNTGRLSGLKYKLVCHFKLVVDMVGMASGSLCLTWTDQSSLNSS